MENRNEIKPYLEYTNEEENQFFHVGDRIICRTKDEKRYIGRIAVICKYQESEETEPEDVIYLNTAQNKMSYSGEIIKIADITYICENPINNLQGYPHIEEKQDQSRFINMIVALGYDRETAEAVYGNMKGITNLHNIPLSSALAIAIQEAGICTDGMCQDELIKIAGKAKGRMIETLQSINDIVKQSWENEIATRDEKQ